MSGDFPRRLLGIRPPPSLSPPISLSLILLPVKLPLSLSLSLPVTQHRLNPQSILFSALINNTLTTAFLSYKAGLPAALLDISLS